MKLIAFVCFDSFDQIFIKKLHLNFWKHVWWGFWFVCLTLIIKFQGFFLKRKTFANYCSQIKFIDVKFVMLRKSFFDKSQKGNLIWIKEILFLKCFIFVDFLRLNFASDRHSLEKDMNFVIEILCIVESFMLIKYNFFHDNKEANKFVHFASLNIFSPQKLILKLKGLLENLWLYKCNQKVNNFTDVRITAKALNVKCKIKPRNNWCETCY